MSVRVAINGFGRIGRNILRAIVETARDDIIVVAINDLGPVETNAHLLRYDSVHGKFPADVKVSGNDLGSLLGNEKQNVEGVKSDINSLDFDELFNLSDNNSFNFQPFTFDLSQGQDSSGGITNTSGGSSPSGNAVTFFPSSNSDPTYHKLNALMTFNII